MTSSEGIEVRPARPSDDALRDRFVEAHARGTFFHLAGWRRVVARVFRHEACDLLALCDGEIVGVLPLMACRGLKGGRNLISMPYAVYGGALGNSARVERALVDAAAQRAETEGCGRLELRCREDPGLDLRASDLYATFVRELPESVDEVLGSLPKKARAEARKARQRHGLVLDHDDSAVDLLVRLFHENKRRLGSPALPAALFHELSSEFGEKVVVHVVRRESQPLTAVMSFSMGDTLYAYYSGSAPNVDRQYSASNFMYMALQEWSVERGLQQFDFGRSRRDAGAFAFKQHQGFEPAPLHYRYHLVRDRELPSLNPSNPKTKWMRETWSRLPLWMTRRLSTPAARYLP